MRKTNHRLAFILSLLMTLQTLVAFAENNPDDKQKNLIPMRLTATIGGFLGNTYRVEMLNGVMTYTAFGPGRQNLKKTTVTPTALQWKEFREALDRLQVWKWQSHYLNPYVMDGTQWALDIAYADHALKSEGSNNYPDANGQPNGKPQPTQTFSDYLKAIQKLIGDRFE